jgi:hypothetical protein
MKAEETELLKEFTPEQIAKLDSKQNTRVNRVD